jgi:hypothetical protein
LFSIGTQACNSKCASCRVTAGAGAVDGFLRERGPAGGGGSEGDRLEEDGFAALHHGDRDLGELDIVDHDLPQVIGESGVRRVGRFEERRGQAHAHRSVLDLFGGDGLAGDGGNRHFVLPRRQIPAGIEAEDGGGAGGGDGDGHVFIAEAGQLEADLELFAQVRDFGVSDEVNIRGTGGGCGEDECE